MNKKKASMSALDQRPWIPANPKIKCTKHSRSKENYDKIIEKFDVEKETRYSPRDGKTYCNIFVWDVTIAMHAEIPHWCDIGGNPSPPEAKNARRMNSNSVWEWLQKYGQKFGWKKVTKEDAFRAANSGKPTIAIWSNPAGNGHIVIVRPSDHIDEIYCAQAGRICSGRIILKEAFGGNQPEFWAHD